MRDDEFPRHQHRRTNGHHRPNGMSARPAHLRPVEEPIDLVAVQADDELISALAAGMTVSAPGYGGYDADDHVAAILASWREDVDADPIPELVDIDTAIATIRSASRPRSRGRHLAPVAAAAAFAVLAVGGLSVGSASAEPGDTLWGISKVLFSERAASVEAADRVQDHIDRAKQALVEGRPEQAAVELQQARADLGAIRPEEGQVALAEVQDFLLAKAAETPPGEVADLTAPLSTQPSRPVPPGVVDPTDPTQPQPALVPGGPAGTEPGPTSSDPRTSPGSATQPDPEDDESTGSTPPRESSPVTTVEPSPTEEDETVPLPPGDDVLPDTTSAEPEPTTTDPAGITEGQPPAQSSGTATGTSTGTVTAQDTAPPTS